MFLATQKVRDFMNKILLITAPDHDITTRYLSAWSGKIFELADKKNIQVINLKRKKANIKELKSRLLKMKPLFIVFNGHGSNSCITGYENKILIQAGHNEDLLKHKIIYAVSCRSAVKLGLKSIKAGALAYIGYAGDFIFCHDDHKISHPLNDKIAKLFLEPSNQVAASLIKGNESEEASKRSKKFFLRNMQKMLSSEASPESSQYAKFLWWDMKCQVCLGDGSSKF